MTYSPLWGDNYSPINNKTTRRKTVARLLNEGELKIDRELMRKLLGVVPGATAEVSDVRVKHNRFELGGKREVETVDILDRATTAADVTDLLANILSYNSTNNAYAFDKSLRP